jgi:phenylacetate-CoA ligase
MSRLVSGGKSVAVARATYGRMRAAHLDAVQAALEDHIARLDWSRDQIERYQTKRLRALLAYACERSPFHARRLRGIDPSSASIADLTRLPMMTKRDAQDEWDAIVTVGDLDRERAERILAEQQWFSYTAGNQQIFSSGGSSGVRGVYVWDWEFFVSASCLAWRMQGAGGAARVVAAVPSAPCGAGGRRPTACKHTSLRCADRSRDGNGRDTGGRTV